MASVVGKTIFSDGKGKLFFGYYKDNDAVEFVDYKTWKKLSFKDVSKGDTNKDRVIKAILKNQKQFNKKVDFNMWSKKGKPSFEDKMDWFIQNGWINNINKGGIREGAADVNKASIPGDIKIKLQKALDVLNGKKLSYQQKLQVLGRVLDSMGIDKSELGRVSQKLKSKLESVNEYDQWRNTRIQSKNIFRMLKQKYNNNIPKMEKGLETILKQNKTKNDQAEVVRQEFKKYFKIKESVNEISIPQLAKKDAEHLDRHVGGKSDREVRAFVDRVYKFYPKDVRKYMSDAFIDYQKNNRTLKYLTTVLRVMHQDIRESVNEDKKQIKDLVKTAKHEKLFYDVLSTMEKKYGKSNYGKWLDKSLKDFGENPSKYRTTADKEEKLFQLGSK